KVHETLPVLKCRRNITPGAASSSPAFRVAWAVGRIPDMDSPAPAQHTSNSDASDFLAPDMREFSQPNPYFPPPPRQIRTLGYAGIGWVAASTIAAATLGVFLVMA